MTSKTEKTAPSPDPIIIKKYPNRRLYNTATSAYITLPSIIEMVLADIAFQVVDSKTGEDLTGEVLNQVIFEQAASTDNSLFNLDFQRMLIRQFSSADNAFLPDYLTHALSFFERHQSDFQTQFATGAKSMLEASQKLAEQNYKIYQKSLESFGFPSMTMPGWPTASEPGSKGAKPEKPAKANDHKSAAANGGDNGGDSETSQPHDQLEDMQRQLDELRAMITQSQ